MKKLLLSLSIFALVTCEIVSAKPLVIAHRGASGYLPEHSLQAATLAYAQGADFIEQDLVLSKDLVPVVLHDIHLETVSNVQLKFPQRHREDGRYYALDFTLAELQSLSMHERTDGQGQQVFPQRYQGKAPFGIATFEQHIELITELNRQFGKNTGFYTEIKSPAWHRKQGVDISKIVLALLRKHRLDDANKAIFVQCFDFAETKRLRNDLGANVKLIQLIGENDWQEAATDYDALRTLPMLMEVAKVAQGIGPWIPQLIDADTMKPSALTKHAHQADLLVHPYTFRQDALPEGINSQQLLDILVNKIKVDGLFTDFTDTVVMYLQAP